MTAKPIAIIEQKEQNSCVHLLLRIDEREQLEFVFRYLHQLIAAEKTNDLIHNYLSDILKGETFFSFRIVENSTVLDFLVTDEKTVSFIFIVVNLPPKSTKKVPHSSDFFRWFANQP